MRSYFKAGSYNVICDLCGFKFKSHQLKQRWDGAMVCSKDFELRHPADLIRVPREITVPAWTRPELDPIYLWGDFLLTEDSSELLTESSDHLEWE
jgi:hypothetical protein